MKVNGFDSLRLLLFVHELSWPAVTLRRRGGGFRAGASCVVGFRGALRVVDVFVWGAFMLFDDADLLVTILTTSQPSFSACE